MRAKDHELCSFRSDHFPAYRPLSSSLVIDHRGCSRAQIREKHAVHFRGEHALLERRGHQFHPAVSCRTVDRKRRMTHAQPWMASLFQIAWRTTEPIHEKVPQTLLGRGKVAPFVDLAEDRILRYAGVEGRHQARKALLADSSVDVVLFHPTIVELLSIVGPASHKRLISLQSISRSHRVAKHFLAGLSPT